MPHVLSEEAWFSMAAAHLGDGTMQPPAVMLEALRSDLDDCDVQIASLVAHKEVCKHLISLFPGAASGDMVETDDRHIGEHERGRQ